MTIELPASFAEARELAEAVLTDADRAALIEAPEVFAGVKRFQPGEVFRNHFHEAYDEYFVCLTGRITLWQGRALVSELTPGASVLCMRGSHHALVNTTDEPATILFVKAGTISAEDTHWVPFAGSDGEGAAA